MPSSSNDLYFFGDAQIQNNPRHMSIIGYEGDRPFFFQFSTVLSQTATQTRVYRDQRDIAKLDWTAGIVCFFSRCWQATLRSVGTHLGTLTVGSRQIHMGELVRQCSPNARSFKSDGTPFEWRRTAAHDYELYAPGNQRIATYSRVAYQTKWGTCHGLFRYAFKNQDALVLEALLALCLNRWIDLNNSL